MNQDSEHLKLLAIFHYVVAGMTALFACIPFLHFFMGLALATGTFPDTEPGAQPIGIFIMVFAGLFILAGWTLAALIAYAGRSLQTRRRYIFCLVMAGVECIVMPFGTVLGVFTIVVLMRDTVKEVFGRSVEPLPATEER
jgi:cytochrome c oxidase subunit IV